MQGDSDGDGCEIPTRTPIRPPDYYPKGKKGKIFFWHQPKPPPK